MEPFIQMIINNLLYLLPSLLGVGLVAFWQRGYFFPYVKVRLSRGKLILAKIINVDRTQYKAALIAKGSLSYGKEGDNKNERVVLFEMERDYIYKEMNVECVNIDGSTMAFLPPDLSSRNLQLIKEIQNDKRLTSKQAEDIYKNLHSGIEGFDPANVDSLVVSAKMKPSMIDDKIKILILMVLGIAVVAGIAAYFAYNNGVAINGMYGDMQNIKAGIETIKQTSTIIATG